MIASANSKSGDGCPGVGADCPLYVLSHDGNRLHLGCVDDLAKPCRVARGRWKFDRAWNRAVREIMRPWQAILAKPGRA